MADLLQQRRRRLRRWIEDRPTLTGTVSVLLMIAVWAIATRSGTELSHRLAPPLKIVTEFYFLILNGYTGHSLLAHCFISLARTTIGFALGSVAGVTAGLVMGANRIIGDAVAPFFSFVRPIPAIAYIPMVILWFGIGEFSKILLIFIASFLYVSLNTAAGVKTVPEDLIRVARTLGISGPRLFIQVVLPESLPYVMLGLRVSLALSWAIVVAAELVAAQSGLGYMIMDAGTFFKLEDLYIGVILIGLIGLSLERLLNAVERKFVHWSGK